MWPPRCMHIATGLWPSPNIAHAEDSWLKLHGRRHLHTHKNKSFSTCNMFETMVRKTKRFALVCTSLPHAPGLPHDSCVGARCPRIAGHVRAIAPLPSIASDIRWFPVGNVPRHPTVVVFCTPGDTVNQPPASTRSDLPVALDRVYHTTAEVEEGNWACFRQSLPCLRRPMDNQTACEIDVGLPLVDSGRTRAVRDDGSRDAAQGCSLMSGIFRDGEMSQICSFVFTSSCATSALLLSGSGGSKVPQGHQSMVQLFHWLLQ